MDPGNSNPCYARVSCIKSYLYNLRGNMENKNVLRRPFSFLKLFKLQSTILCFLSTHTFSNLSDTKW